MKKKTSTAPNIQQKSQSTNLTPSNHLNGNESVKIGNLIDDYLENQEANMSSRETVH